VRTDMSPIEILQLANFGRTLSRGDIVALPPNGDLTPGFFGAGGASLINLSPAYRGAVRRLVTSPRIAAEHAEITVLNAGAPPGTGGAVSDLLGKNGLTVTKVEVTAPQPATRIEAGPGVRHSAESIAQLLGLTPGALAVTDDPGTDIRVLLGPDARLPAQR
jgi:hypothetical protein